jgi:hypothetical protein
MHPISSSLLVADISCPYDCLTIIPDARYTKQAKLITPAALAADASSA